MKILPDPATAQRVPVSLADADRSHALLEAQQQILESIIRGRPLAEVLAALCVTVEAQAHEEVRAAILLTDATGRQLFTGAAPSLPEHYNQAVDGIAIASDLGTCGAAAARREVVITPDIDSDPGWVTLKHLPLALGLRAAWSMPILSSAGRVLGTFGTYFPEAREPSVDERKLVEVLVRTAALAIERQQSDMLMQEDAARHQFLARLADATQRLSEAEDVMTITARMLAEYLQADRCAYAEVDAETVFVVTGDHARAVPSIVGRWEVEAFGADCVRAMLAGVPFVVADTDADPEISAADLPAYRATNIRAGICVPLHKNGKFTAAMAVHQSHPRYWTSAEVTLVQLVVARCWETLERSRVARTLQASEVRYRAMVEASPECVKLLAGDGTVLQMNEAGLRMFEASEASMVGRNFYELVAPEYRRAFRSFNERICRGEKGTLEFEIIGLRGTRRWMESKAAPLHNENGAYVQLSVTRDVTALKLDRQHLDELYEHLRDQDRRKDEFLATLAHELRNPLAPVCTGLQVLQLSPDEGLRDRTRQMMQRQLGHLVHMVDDLLDVSRITLGKLTLKITRLDFRAVLHSALETTRPLIEARGHELSVRLAQEALPLDADATRLTQVIANLLNNAAKYTPPGGRIQLLAETEGEILSVRIQDTGVGIPQDMLPSVFEMFIQVGRSVEHAQGGLGIGLTLVRRLVELHGGSIEAHSPGPGLGSTFVLQLPLARGAPQNSGAALRAADHAGSSTLRILVVDDNVDAAESLAELLNLDGHDVCLAHDGAAALAVAREQRPDVILLDIGLPGLNGYEVAVELRKDAGSQPFLVALTGWGSEEDRRSALEAGFDEHLVKPAAIAALYELLGRVVARGNVKGIS